MNVLILGSGGREHALAWKIARSSQLNKLFIAPGNAGTEAVGKNIPIDATDFNAIKRIVLENDISMLIVGPEQPLVDGIHDFFSSDKELKKVVVIGPKKEGAMLEGSKDFSKEFMLRHDIPTAKYQSFTKETIDEGFKFLTSLQPPFVLKADGLAAGKGVLILNNVDEAKRELSAMLTHEKFGVASQKVVIEEFLDGIEMSCFALTDGKEFVMLPNAKDYKRIGEADTGLNTGGMGAISPVPFAEEALQKEIEQSIVRRTINGLQKDGIAFQGFLFFGLMIVNNKPFLIEYNVRMGDPETEVVIPRIQSDLLELFKAATTEKLSDYQIEISPLTVTTVMAVSGGYPESYDNNKQILGLDKIDESVIFHAGTKTISNKLVTNGGRVLAVTSFGDNMKEALAKSYASLKKLHFDKMYYRKDIGFDL